MGPAQTVSLLLAGGAVVAGLAIVGVMWRRHRRRARARRGRHPSTLPPITVSLDERGDGTHLRIDVRTGAPRTAVDIVSFRPASPDAAWESEPIVTPIVIDPGGFALMPTPLGGSTRWEVVVAWTTHHPTGEIQGSRGFEVPEPRGEWSRLTLPARPQLSGLPAVALGILLAATAALVVLSSTGVLEREPDDLPLPTTTAVRLSGDAAAAVATTTSTVPATTTTTITTAATTITAITAITTTTTAPATTTSTTTGTTTTNPPTGSSAPADATSPGSGPAVAITGRTGECQFGPDCLIASFTVSGFEPRPGEYICEFEDGGRFSFTFDSDGVDDACATGTVDAEITIEVGGVRSPTLSRSDV